MNSNQICHTLNADKMNYEASTFQIRVPWLKTLKTKLKVKKTLFIKSFDNFCQNSGLEEIESENRIIISKLKQVRTSFNNSLDFYHHKNQNLKEKNTLLFLFKNQKSKNLKINENQNTNFHEFEIEKPILAKFSKESIESSKNKSDETPKKFNSIHNNLKTKDFLNNKKENQLDFFVQDGLLIEEIRKLDINKIKTEISQQNQELNNLKLHIFKLFQLISFSDKREMEFFEHELYNQEILFLNLIGDYKQTRIKHFDIKMIQLKLNLKKINLKTQDFSSFICSSKLNQAQEALNKISDKKSISIYQIELTKIHLKNKSLSENINQENLKICNSSENKFQNFPFSWNMLMLIVYITFFLKSKNITKDYLNFVFQIKNGMWEVFKKSFWPNCGSSAETHLAKIFDVLEKLNSKTSLEVIFSIVDFLIDFEQKTKNKGKFQGLKSLNEILAKLKKIYCVEKLSVMDFLLSDFTMNYFKNPMLVYFFLVNSDQFLTPLFRICNFNFIFENNSGCWNQEQNENPVLIKKCGRGDNLWRINKLIRLS